MMAIQNIRIRLQELICRPVWTELATVHRVRIRDVTARIIDVLAQVLLACLARRRTDVYVFDRCAGDPSTSGR